MINAAKRKAIIADVTDNPKKYSRYDLSVRHKVSVTWMTVFVRENNLADKVKRGAHRPGGGSKPSVNQGCMVAYIFSSQANGRQTQMISPSLWTYKFYEALGYKMSLR